MQPTRKELRGSCLAVMRVSMALSEDRDVPFLPKPNSVALVLSNECHPKVVTALAHPRASGRWRDS
jgi:hypothetical protein